MREVVEIMNIPFDTTGMNGAVKKIMGFSMTEENI